jgi:uncharacterized protein (TIGR02147 family)
MDMEANNIYEYADFRSYLNDWYLAEKARRGKFTKGEVSRLLGLPNSRNYFSDLLGGKELSETFQERLVELLELSRDEARYFRALVSFQQANSPEVRETALDLLVSLNRSPRTILGSHQFEYFRHWRHGAIRALLDTGNYGDEPLRIGRSLNPSVSAPEVRASLKLLAKLELIDKNEYGFWKPTDRAVSAPDGQRESFVLELQLQQLELVRQTLLQRSGPRRMVATNVVSVSAAGYGHLLARMEKTRSEIRSLVHKDSDPIEQVCQIVLALIPLNNAKEQP